MRKTNILVASSLVILAFVLLFAGCSTEVETGSRYVCKECGRTYREDVTTMSVSKDEAELLSVKEIEGYCPKCGDEDIEFEQTRHLICAVCGDSVGDETKMIKIQRKQLDDIGAEKDVMTACDKPACKRIGAIKDKYDCGWEEAKGITEGNIDIGFTKPMLIASWGQPESTSTSGSGTVLSYEGGSVVTIGANGTVIKIK